MQFFWKLSCAKFYERISVRTGRTIKITTFLKG